MSIATIMVVDDEPFNLEIISEYLCDMNFTMELYESGSEAWSALSDPNNRYDLIILDRMMPAPDGMTLLRQIKSDARLNRTPVIMQTAASSPEQVREGLSAGAYYYLTKPFESESLISIVKAALNDKQRFVELVNRITEHASALQLLQNADFYIRVLDEAHALAAFLAMLAPEPEMVAMGLSELLVNGIEHGNLGISFVEKSALKQEDAWETEVARRLQLPEYRQRRVHVRLEQHNDEWVLTVSDEGDGFDWQKYLDFDPARAFAPNGRGIAMARQLAFSSLKYLGKGNVVQVTLPLKNSI